ncbi:2-acyl-glycerophospho-ethanolamine acyltransferase [Polystyrenella longa]|uniref:2-acyl-glycerophospho-ethanolamine acyltransferase n=1 Tax=Polystyrenella longa TaxID=2528007 RepID=A0A518CRK9_9PLAN|nr:lysophospholipid acyltransferase family protein [Polystyrenella longa]QDU81859.1 2-acyl-glycerophospho-ethanolamine acyltransferase [Polystyrenella longa]
MNPYLSAIFFWLIVRPIVLIVLGLNVRQRERLPKTGPAIIVANHNSHLDALVLMTLYGTRQMKNVRPVAAADYFLKNKFLTWFSTQVIGIIPISRVVSKTNVSPLAPIDDALANNQILILFPEGSRGDPEKIEQFKGGIARISQHHPEVDIVPVFMHGLGKALPRGEALLVPFFCDIFVGSAFRWTGSRASLMEQLTENMQQLRDQKPVSDW